MGLASEMKDLSEDLLTSFKNRIRENEELVNDVQKTLDSFRKDHQEMAAVLNNNAAALRKGLAGDEKERLNTFNELMAAIHNTITSIRKEVLAIQTSTVNMINEFATDRAQMTEELNKSFAQGRADRTQNEKNRMKEFDTLLKNINDDIKSINDEVLTIFKNTNGMIDRFEKEHLEMSSELKAEMSKNLAERVEYTRSLLNGFQKRLSEIGKENQKMAQKLRKDLANGEVERLKDFNGIMKGIHLAIKEIRKDVNDIQKATAGMLDDLLQNREGASAEWNKMQEAMAQIRNKEIKMDKPVDGEKKNHAKDQPKAGPKPSVPMTLEKKVLDYINKHPYGVKISEMEKPLGEIRMKLGFTVKNLLNDGKVQKIDTAYFPVNIK